MVQVAVPQVLHSPTVSCSVLLARRSSNLLTNMAKPHKPGDMFRAFQAKKQKSAVMSGRPASNVIPGSGGAYVRNYAGFTKQQATSISSGLKNGTVRGEPNSSGGEYISANPSTGKFKRKASKSVKRKASNPNSPANYGPAMQRAFTNTKVFGRPMTPSNSAPLRGVTPGVQRVAPISAPRPVVASHLAKRSVKRKASSTIAPINRGRAAQAAYANKFGTVPVSKKKRKASKLDMEMAFKKKGAKKKAMTECA